MHSIFCIVCEGKGYTTCTWCSGNGELNTPSGKVVECPVCEGFGEERCSDCDD